MIVPTEQESEVFGGIFFEIIMLTKLYYIKYSIDKEIIL